MDRVLLSDSRLNGKGCVSFAWSPDSTHIASCATLTRVLTVWAVPTQQQQQWNKVWESKPENPVISMSWDHTGSTLCLLHSSPCQLLLVSFPCLMTSHLSLPKDTLFVECTPCSDGKIAIGSGKGEVLFVQVVGGTPQLLASSQPAKLKKKIIAGAWSQSGEYAYASEDRQIMICNNENKIIGQVKVKSKPTSVKFGGTDPSRDTLVSVLMARQTLLLYNLSDPENALELAFQARYGEIAKFQWFGKGQVMVGFVMGYVVVISTHMEEIGREQFCAKFHRDSLRDLAYSSAKHKVATAGDTCIKIIDMNDWKEVYTEEISEKGMGLVEKIEWSNDGNYLCASTRTGCLFVYSMDATPSHTYVAGTSSYLLHAIISPLTPSSFLLYAIVTIVMATITMSYVADMNVVQFIYGVASLFNIP